MSVGACANSAGGAAGVGQFTSFHWGSKLLSMTLVFLFSPAGNGK